MAVLEIKDLCANVEDKKILKGVDLIIKTGEIHAVMGPNGAGKSTLAAVIMGHPIYTVTSGAIYLDGENVLEMSVDERARAGLFLAMQYPSEIPGVETVEFLRAAMNTRRPEDDKISIIDFEEKLEEVIQLVNIPKPMIERYLNVGFSGGEKKRNEILQLLMLEPSFAILDEIDSGLDIDALKYVSNGINAMRGPDFAALLITHYERLLSYTIPDVVHIMVDGKIALTGDASLARRLEKEGYKGLEKELGLHFSEEGE